MPICLRSTMSKVLEKMRQKMLLKTLKLILLKQELIPYHQFGFRKQHSIIWKRKAIVALDILLTFNMMYHEKLFLKLKLMSYHTNSQFMVRYLEEIATATLIKSDVFQGQPCI